MFKHLFFKVLFCVLVVNYQNSYSQDLDKSLSINFEKDRLWLEHNDGYVELWILHDTQIKVKEKNRKYYHFVFRNRLYASQGGYTGKILDGLSTEFYFDLTMKSKGNYSLGLKDGKWKYWRQDGTIEKIENWKMGEFLSYIQFSDNGEMSERKKLKETWFLAIINKIKDSVLVFKNKRKL